MAFTNVWYNTAINEKLVNIVEEEILEFDSKFEQARVVGGFNLDKRDSKTSWLPENHWIAGLCYHYVLLANKENFLYDIEGFHSGAMQYTSYTEDEYYGWHIDGDITSLPNLPENIHERYIVQNSEKIRKLSVILQLSDPDEYEGGEVQLMTEDGSTFFVPKTRGTIVVFDSRTKHRVKKVISGQRKSIVGWVLGPRWK